jgi:propionyl-CoA carboxylase alpha chain
MNTRLQVEHPVTELVTGIDLVEQMIRVAAGERLAIAQEEVELDGWAIESRLYAEDPYRNFLPSIGRLTSYRPPEERRTGTLAVRNDTGVFEGGEISMFYDPMIAKLCTWAPTRAAAIEGMRDALDAFEVEGIGHNLPFLSAVMDHPRFACGALTTAFIAEEWPEGFAGATLPEATLRELAALAAHLQVVSEARAAGISGAMANHARQVGRDWVVLVDRAPHRLAIDRRDGRSDVTFEDGAAVSLSCAWRPGDTLARAEIEGRRLVAKVQPVAGGWRIRHRGADLRVAVLSPRHAELALTMPEKAPPDTSKLLLCPMPGLVVRIDVGEGDEVFDGQALCMVEAMKMENVLRAERRAKVAKVRARPGDSLAVDDVIMEFE